MKMNFGSNTKERVKNYTFNEILLNGVKAMFTSMAITAVSSIENKLKSYAKNIMSNNHYSSNEKPTYSKTVKLLLKSNICDYYKNEIMDKLRINECGQYYETVCEVILNNMTDYNKLNLIEKINKKYIKTF